ncbi:MAG: cytosine permease [Candidatus Caldarchaeum sp.]|jgi:putative hydroxymethylpyrimidine transporter CytX
MKIRLPPEWGTDPVPENSRILRFFDYFVLWSSLGVGLLVMVAGSFLSSLSFFEVLAVSLAGSVIGSLMLASAGVVGSRYGVPTMVSLRPVLGLRGSYVPTVLNIVQLIGWTGFEIMIMAQAAGVLTGWLFGELSFPLWVVVFSLWCLLLALGGPLAVVRKWLERYAIWLVYISSIWITYLVATSPGVGQWLTGGKPDAIPLLLALDIVVAMPVSWWPLVSDYNRFAAKSSSSFWGTLSGYTLSNTWFYLLGAALVAVLGINDIISAIGTLFLGNAALILILVDETDNGFADIYSSAVSFQNIFPKTPQWVFAAFTTAAGALLALTVPLLQYEWFLLLIGSLFVPLLGAMTAEFFINRRNNPPTLDEFYQSSGVKIRGFVSWIAGILVYVAIIQLAPDIGASLPSFLTAVSVSVLQAQLLKRPLEKETR